MPWTFQTDACTTWINKLDRPEDLHSHRFLASLVSAAGSEEIAIEDIAYYNMTPSVQPFLSPPDVLLCRIA